jgi:hypothetical protein
MTKCVRKIKSNTTSTDSKGRRAHIHPDWFLVRQQICISDFIGGWGTKYFRLKITCFCSLPYNFCFGQSEISYPVG